MLRRLRKPAIVLAASAAAALSVALAGPASAAPAHHAAVTRLTAAAQPARPAASYGIQDGDGGWAKFDSTSGIWRAADSGTSVYVYQVNTYWQVEDVNTGNCMDWVNGTPPSAQETACTAARAHYSVTNCSGGSFELHDLYAGSLGDSATLIGGPGATGITYTTSGGCGEDPAGAMWTEVSN